MLAVLLLVEPRAVHAQINDFYSGNNILFFKANDAVCATGTGEGTSTLVGDDNLEKILRFYVGKGLTLIQAAGIAGNYSQESGFNPRALEPSSIAEEGAMPIDGRGFGIAQWTWTSRQQPLVDLAKETGRSTTDLSLQLDFSWWEMETGTGHGMNLDEFKATETPEDAAYVFNRDFEVSADSEANIKRRRGAPAREIYEIFKSVIPDGSTTTPGSNGACTGDGSASSFAVDGLTVYDQEDPRWGSNAYGESTIAISGCGPVAMAAIITALTKKPVTPDQTAKYGAEHGTLYENGHGGSLHNIHEVVGENWGLSSYYTGPDVAKINEALRKGDLVIAAGTGPAPFTSSGHFIVIRGVTADGKWKVADSNGSAGIENSKKEWDPESILSSIGSYAWALSAN